VALTVRVLERYLSPEQKGIAELSVERNLLVVAGPGSGKTHLLTHVAAYQVRRSHPASWRVLCLTFGKEASKEMRSRLRQPRLEIQQPWRVVVDNFHGFASELLGRYGHLQGWPRDAQIFDDSEAQEVVGEVINELDLRNLTPKAAYDGMKQLRHRRPLTGRVPAPTLAQIRLAYELRMAELKARDYDDLVLHAIRLLDDQPRVAEIVRQTYRYIVVDELQDTSGFQLEFVARLSGEGNTRIFGVADDDQMIYGWRDARAENIDEWESRFGAQRRQLLGNYRCPANIVAAANSLIAHNRPNVADAPYSLRTDRQGELLIAQASANDKETEAELVADIVEAEVARGVAAAEVAILAPNRFLFDHIESALDGRGIACVRVGEDPAAARPLARVLRTALALAVAPTNERGRARLGQLLGFHGDRDGADEAIDSLLDASSVAEMIERVRVRIDLPDDDEDLVHARQIVSLAQREWGGDPPSVIGRRIALEWHRLSVQLQRGQAAVKIMTTFGAKGLEFRTVVLPGFGWGEIPYVPRGRVFTESDLEEERRKLYVEITRSSDRVVFTYRTQSPAELLGEIDSSLLADYQF
jgi:superfamily I DNA/RNA helicase